MGVPGLNRLRFFASLAAQHGSDPGCSGGIVSSFRRICIRLLTTAMVVFAIDAAAAQSATDQAGKAYLAGLRPPHEHPNAAHGKTSRAESPHKPTTKSPRQTVKREPTVTARSKTHHRPVRLAEKINSRIAWPSVEPTAADQPATSESVLQFATEDATSDRARSAPAVTAHSPVPAAAAAKTAPPVNVATTDRHDSAEKSQDNPQDTTAAVPQPVEAPPPRQMRVIAPALSEAPVATSTPTDQPPERSRSATAQMLATIAGAIAACVVAFLIFGLGLGFGSPRIRQI
jgi:thiol:disulfide interchange protein